MPHPAFNLLLRALRVRLCVPSRSFRAAVHVAFGIYAFILALCIIAYLVTSIVLLHAVRIDVTVIAILSALSLFVYLAVAYLPFASNGSVIASQPLVKEGIVGAFTVIILLWIVPVLRFRRTIREHCRPEDTADVRCPTLRAIRLANLIMDVLYIVAAVSVMLLQSLLPWSPRRRAFRPRCGVRQREGGNVLICCCVEVPEEDAAGCFETAGCWCVLLADDDEEEEVE